MLDSATSDLYQKCYQCWNSKECVFYHGVGKATKIFECWKNIIPSSCRNYHGVGKAIKIFECWKKFM